MHDVAKLDAVIDAYADRLEAALQRHAKDKPVPVRRAVWVTRYNCSGRSLNPARRPLARLTGLADACKGADWLITGEGRSDAQTPARQDAVRRRADCPRTRQRRAQGHAAGGGVDATALAALNETFNGGCFSIVPRPDGARSGRHPRAGAAGERR